MLRMQMKNLFFDTPKVQRSVDRGTRRVLSRFGAFVRRSAKSSIRPRKRVSRPGEPPSSHTGLLKKFIFFAYQPRNKSVVIGPVQLTQKGRGEAPRLLEHGGTATLQRHGKRDKANFRAHFQGRPFMGPAFLKEQPKLPEMWRQSIR